MSGVRFLFLLVLLILFSHSGKGQRDILSRLFEVPYDTNYISSYTTDFTTRLFSSIKYSMMGYDDGNVDQRLAYRPNNKMLLGMGVNHGFLGLNIGIDLPLMNEDDDEYGETKYYDFTLRMFAPKFNLTAYLQTYRGFYLRNTSTLISGWEEGDPYYIRSDIRTNTFGLDISYIFNSDRFSYRAALVQTEWQKKSAGSMIIGGSVLYNFTTGDSSIVPSRILYPEFYDSLQFRRSNILSIGPHIGYAYTLVLKKHYFLTGSINGSLNIGSTKLILMSEDDEIKSGMILTLRTEFMVSGGYNSHRWYFGISYVNLALNNQAPLPNCTFSYDTGMFRMNVVRRIGTKKPIKILNPRI